MPSQPATPRPDDRRPATLSTAAALVALQALSLVGIGVFYLVELVVADADDVTRAAVSAALVLASGTGLALVARGLVRRRRWSRSPAVVANLLVLPVAYDLVRGDRWPIGVPLAGWSVAVLVLLFWSSTSAALEE